MKQDTKAPLWKELNEQREAKNEWAVSKDGGYIYEKESDDPCRNFAVLELPSKNHFFKTGNIHLQYTALAVNNLHILAEALEVVYQNTPEGSVLNLKAKEALSKIS